MRTYAFLTSITGKDMTDVYHEAWERRGEQWHMTAQIDNGKLMTGDNLTGEPIADSIFEGYVKCFDSVDWNVVTMDAAGLIPAPKEFPTGEEYSEPESFYTERD